MTRTPIGIEASVAVALVVVLHQLVTRLAARQPATGGNAIATVKHNEWLDAMLGDWVHSFIDLNTDNIDLSLLDQTDSGTITATTVVYDTVDAATVVATGDMPSISSITNGVVTLSGALTFTSVTGDAADYLTLWKNSGTPSTSPLIITWDSATTGLPVTPNGGNIVVTWSSNILLTLA